MYDCNRWYIDTGYTNCIRPPSGIKPQSRIGGPCPYTSAVYRQQACWGTFAPAGKCIARSDKSVLPQIMGFPIPECLVGHSAGAAVWMIAYGQLRQVPHSYGIIQVNPAQAVVKADPAPISAYLKYTHVRIHWYSSQPSADHIRTLPMVRPFTCGDAVYADSTCGDSWCWGRSRCWSVLPPSGIKPYCRIDMPNHNTGGAGLPNSAACRGTLMPACERMVCSIKGIIS